MIQKANFEDQIRVVDMKETAEMTMEILEFIQLKGSQSPSSAMNMFLAQQSGLRLRQVKITLRNGSVKTEAGALYFSKGKIECETQIGGISGVIGKMLKSTLNSESAIKPVYSGFGEIYLEPTFSHFIMLDIIDDSIVVDKGCFYCCSSGMKVSPVMQANISSAFLSNEGLFQTKIAGTGIIILEIPVPHEEILKYTLNGDKLQVDGNFAILRSGTVKFSVQKSTKSLIGSFLGGEGFLHIFEGEGDVWLAPTAPVYKRLRTGGVDLVNSSNKSMGNNQ